MEAYIWLILASMLAVGMLIGFFIGRSKGDTSAPRVQELEETLTKANEEMQSYRTQVTQHFEKTANLFNQLTSDYRDVYEHLASSSEQLCGGDQTVKLKSLTSDRKVLEGEGKVETLAEPEVKETASAETQQAAEAEAEEPAAATTESEQEFVPPPSETTGVEQKAEEARTIH